MSITFFFLWLMWSMVYIRVDIDYVISRYRSQIRRPCDIASPRDRTISCTNERHVCVAHRYRPNAQTMGTGDNYISDSHLKGPDIRPVGDRAPPCLPTHLYMHCLICTSPTQHPACSSHWWWVDDDNSGVGEGGGLRRSHNTDSHQCDTSAHHLCRLTNTTW